MMYYHEGNGMDDTASDAWVASSLARLDETNAPPWTNATSERTGTMSRLIRTVTESGEETIEVRPDPPAVTLALSGLPDCCPHCGEEPAGGQWPLSVCGTLLNVMCPGCWTTVAPVRAVAAADLECE